MPEGFLKEFRRPELEAPMFVFAFAGWADAAESATHALRYLVKRLGGIKFAEIDAEEFYDFTQVRPHTAFDDDGNRIITWPANEFYVVKGGEGGTDLVIFIGIEPSMRWRTFAESMVALVKDLGVSRIMQIGALLDAVPHTREPRITGTATSPELQELLGDIEVRRSRYTGPTGISGVLNDAFRRQGLQYVSLWGHSPHYLHVSPNPKVSLSLLKAMEQVLHVEVDVEQLRTQGSNFERRVRQALSNEPEVSEYVQRLESQWDTGGGDRSRWSEQSEANDMPEPEEAVRDLEEFLKRSRTDESDAKPGE